MYSLAVTYTVYILLHSVSKSVVLVSIAIRLRFSRLFRYGTHVTARFLSMSVLNTRVSSSRCKR